MLRMAGATGTKRAASPPRAISPPPLKRTVTSKAIQDACSNIRNTPANQAPPPRGEDAEKTAANFFAPLSQKKPEPISWRVVGKTLVVGKYTTEEKEKKKDPACEKLRIAAFDMDSTLITTASGQTFAKNPADWKWWHSSVPSRLQELASEGYQIVIVSNQKQIAIQSKNPKKAANDPQTGDSKSLSNFKQRASAVLSALDLSPLSIYAATEYDEFRKPRLGMWHEFLNDYGLETARVDLAQSFFVGDAAGRKNDHSQVDLGFASNIGVSFKTPEEYFLNAPAEEYEKPFDPSIYLHADTDIDPPVFTRQHTRELVIFCGSPGAGKSTFYWNVMEPLGYERVNQDILKSRPKCLKVARQLLTDGKSVAVDNTNADPETRSHWISLAKELSVPIRCVLFLSTPELCRHNNAVRAANKELNPESRASLPGIAFGDFSRRFREPVLDEGLSDIVRVGFRFEGGDEARRLWGQYWI